MANLLSNTTIGGYQSIHTGNVGSYAITSLSGYATQSWVQSQAYITSSNNYYYVNPGNGYGLGFWGQVPTTYGITMANESAGYGVIYGLSEYHLYFSMTGGGNRGFVFRNDAHGAVTQIGAYGWQMWRGELYPGYNNSSSGSQTSYYIYGNTNNAGLRTNGNWLVNGNLYIGSRDVWFSDWFNQAVKTDSNPTFASIYLNGTQLTGTQTQLLKNTLDVTTLPYKVDITVNGDANTFYAVQFWGGDQDVWRRIIIKRGYGETAPWDPIGTGVHHGGLLLDWEGNFGGWGGAEYADRIRVFNESYTNVCADMFIWSHSMGYVFMLRGGGAIYHLFSDQPINGFYQAGAPDIAYSTSTLLYDDTWSGTNQYDVPAPAPLTLAQVNSSRIDGLRTKKQSLLDARYVRQNVDISGVTNISSTNFLASNAFYLNGTSYYLNATDGGVYSNVQIRSGTQMKAPIFYDTDTNYYLDLNSTTSLRTVGSWRSDSSTWDGEFSGKMQYHSSSWYIQAADSLLYRNAGGNNVFLVNQAGDATAVGSMRSPIFYDSADTGYYLDPNGLSVLSHIRLNNNWANAGVNQGAINIRGQYPSMVFRNTVSDSMWLRHMDGSGSIQHYYASDGVDSSNWSIKHSMHGNGNFSSVGTHTASQFNGSGAGLTGTASSLSVGYATTAGALSSMNISQFTNNSGYITSSSLSSYLPLAGGTMSGKVYTLSTGTGTYDGAFEIRETSYVTTSQSAWGYAPGITYHWGGRVVSKVGLRSDGLFAIDNEPFATHSWVNGRGFITGYTETDTLASVTGRGATTASQVSFTKTDDHAISVGTIRGRAVGVQTGEFIQLFERVNIGGPSGWGASNTSAPSYGLSVYGGATIGYGNSAGLTVTGTTNATRYTLSGTGAYMEGYGSNSSRLGKVAIISFDWNSNYDEPYNHGIMSTNANADFADSISINSFNDITLRLDANNNNSESYLRIMNNTTGNSPIAYIGYDGGSSVAWFGGVVTAANDFRAPIFYDSANTNYYGDFASTSVMNSIRFGTSSNNGTLSGASDWGMRLTTDSGYIQFGPANSSYAHIYTDRGSFYFNKALEVNGNTVIHAGTIGSQSVSYASSAQYLSNSNYIIQRGSNGSWNADFTSTPAGTMSYAGDLGANTTNGPGGTWWMQQNFRHTNASNYWGTQVAWGWEDNANRLATRNITGGNYGAWVYYLNSSNFTSYAPSLTGSGASGTWSINVTGSAGSAGNTATIDSNPNRTDSTPYPVVWSNGNSQSPNYSCAAVTIQSSTGKLTATSFTGAGTGLTGTAASLSIGGNAATATNVAWTGVTGRPTALSQFSNDLGNYGGFLTSLGFSYSTGVSANHVVQRDSNGYIYANHINFNTGESENPTISSFITSNGDGWSRKSSLAHVRNQLGNYGGWITSSGSISGNAATATTATNMDNGKVYSGTDFMQWRHTGGGVDLTILHSGVTGAFDFRTETKFRNQDGVEFIRMIDLDYWTAKMTFNIDMYNMNNGLGADGGDTALAVDADWHSAAIRHSGIIQAVSDRREKHQILPITDAVTKVKGITGSTYYRDNNIHRFAGVIAQDVKEVLPEAVWGSEDTRYSVDYNALIALLIQATKEQQNTIDALTARIQALENK